RNSLRPRMPLTSCAEITGEIALARKVSQPVHTLSHSMIPTEGGLSVCPRVVAEPNNYCNHALATAGNAVLREEIPQTRVLIGPVMAISNSRVDQVRVGKASRMTPNRGRPQLRAVSW